jgi:putative ABC transport system substrate-binding protein
VNNRRKLVIALGASAITATFDAFAQQPAAKVFRMGFLGSTSASGYASQVHALRGGLRDLGYVEGKNIQIEWRFAEGNYGRLPELGAELVQPQPRSPLSWQRLLTRLRPVLSPISPGQKETSLG